MCMLRHRRLSGSAVPAALLYSSRAREDVIYREELQSIAGSDPQVAVRITLTRDVAPGRSGGRGRIDLSTVRPLRQGVGGVAEAFVCGPNGFVDAASALLLRAGQPAEALRTERFGPTGAEGG